MTEIIIREQRNIDFACGVLQNLDRSKTHIVKVEEYSPTRSQAQNRLMRLWLTVIGNVMGQTQDEMHIQCKGLYLLPILLRDGHEETTQMHEAVKTVWNAGMKEQAITAKKNMVRHMISTTWLSVKQMTEYLREIEGMARDGGVALPYPDDYDWIMNQKRTR